MTDQLVQDIMDYRKEKDFKATSELSSVVGADVFGAISPFITFEESSYYTISSLGLLSGDRIRRGIRAMVEINPTLKRGWRVVEWHDGIKPQLERPPGKE